MTKNKLITLVSIVMLSTCLHAQQTAIYTNAYVDYQKALTLYNNKQYHAAQTLFDKIKQDTKDNQLESDCAYYIANCAVRLNQQNADALMQGFVETYPTSTKRNTAYLDVADYYFEQSKYAYARKWYDKVSAHNMARSEREKFDFNYGYALYATGDKTTAQRYFNRVIDSKTYGAQAKYYIGYMAYEGDDYTKANEYFEQVNDQEKYKEKLSYYQADLNFKLGNFNKAIELAKAQIPKSNPSEVSELSKIIGESYFNLKKYDKAIPYLKDYKGKNGKWSHTDYYLLGYAYYKQNDFEKALSEFNKIIGGNNGVAQNAYYHLGESYINLDKKQEALNAFRNASQMDFDLKIQEDAWLNYAKISYEIGNPYQSVPQVLTGYLDKYPNTLNKEEIEALLIDSYITSKNYAEAIKLLEGKRSYNSRVAFQKVAFYRGLEVYNENQYQEAKALFQKSLKEAKDELFTTRATYWKAETDYNLNNFNEALLGFKEFYEMPQAAATPEIQNVDYNLAYTYFKLKNYAAANDLFKQYINAHPEDKLRVNDAYLRLGDGYFASSNYNMAIKAYNKAIEINQIQSDYPFFQKAISYGFDGQESKKRQELETFILRYQNSALRDDALYELGNAYVKANDNTKALAYYDQLNLEYKNSVFIPKALLRQGLVYYNANNNEQALAKFKKVAKAYPNTEEANQAVKTVRLIYIDLGQVDEYARWVKTLDYINVTDADLDNATYLAAEKQYLEHRTDKAITQFNAYLNQFPNGMHALKSHFYLAELYTQKELPENALPHFEYVMSKPRGEYTEQAAVKLSEIYLNNARWDKAIPILKRLEVEADYPQNIIYAQSNLMNAFYQGKEYGTAEAYAQKVLKSTKLDAKVKSDAQIIIARSAIKTGNNEKAKAAYAIVETIATGALAAEALYYNAYFKNQEANYKGSNQVVQKLAKDYSSYKYYSAKGLVLMAKNYDALKDAFQATYILESVIKNFKDFDDVIAEAQQELSRIKAQEAKTNASIQANH